MVGVVRAQRDLGRLDHDAALLAAVDAAYPFGERKYLPYKMWLLERKLFRDAYSVPTSPTADEATACMVARDMLERDPSDVQRVMLMLDEQAPNRLSRRCPVCATRPGGECRDFESIGDVTKRALLVVPHEARLTGHLDAGPLFAGPR